MSDTTPRPDGSQPYGTRPGEGDWIAYAVAVLFPFIGLIVGIVWAAKSKIGPALAIWATSLMATCVWVAISL